MPSLGIRTNLVHNGSKLSYLRWFASYFKRVLADSGEVPDNVVTKQILKHLQDNKTYDSTKLLFCPEAGIKLRESGVNFYVPKIYDLAAGDGVNQDGTQTTESNQPYLSGNIAPNEKLSLKGNSFDNRRLTHQDISFADSLPFSFTFVANPIGSNHFANYDYYSFGGIKFGHRNDGNFYFIYNGNGGLTIFPGATYRQIHKGKTNIYTIVVENRRLELYVNNIHIGYLTREDSSVGFNMLWLSGTSSSEARCSFFYHRIQSGAMTSEQVSAEYTLLRSLYPEIPSVTIGTQEWATSNLEMIATPMANIIANVTAATNVEKITTTADRDFSSDTGWWTKGTGWTIGSGVASSDGTQTDVSNLSRAAAITTEKWHKVVFTVSGRTAGTIKPLLGTATITAIAADGTYTYYIKSNGTSIIFQADADFVGSIDNVSCGEIGWANSQELYDGLIAQGYSEADAVKEAAMWCYYNNDPAIGAIYGKLYNWFAAKLLQNDIDAYNAANPTTPWGWHVPSHAEFGTLATALGGASVAGGKMKVAGTDYWDSPNTGADNSSGFSVLGGGYRYLQGSYLDIKRYGALWASAQLKRVSIDYNTAELQMIDSQSNLIGYSIRLIKD